MTSPVGRPRILVVEDEVIVARDIGLQLVELGYEPVGHATQGEQAVALTMELRPDLVLMDIQLAGAMDGIVAAQAIRSRFSLPVVFLTAFAEDDTLACAKLTEPFGYILKPFSERELRTVMEMALYKHKAEAKLRANEEKFHNLFESSPDAIVVATREGIIHTINRQAERLFGYAREELIGQTIENLMPRRFGTSHIAQRESYVHDPRIRSMGKGIDLFARRKDGSEFPVDISLSPFSTPEGLMVISNVRDITERRQLEDELRQAQKMEAIGQLVGGVAHDFNNILAAILGNAELALADTTSEHPARESLEEIRRASRRAKSLVQQILAFSRGQTQERRVITLRPIIEESTSLLRAILPASVQLVMSMESDVPPVLADPTQMHQVLVNLCTNAWHALEDLPGRVEIKLQPVTLDGDLAGELAGLQPGRFACISVRDTGKGMEAALVTKIFNPFFTTKEQGKGTGLGLSVVHGIIQGHGGAITVESQPGQGATFHVYLPAATAPEDSSSAPASPPHHGEGQRILFLDDEASLVLLATRLLKRLGYRVTGFTRVADALEAFRANPGQFDLAITDLNMPGTSGLDFAGELLKLRPELPVMLSSGHVTGELRQRVRDAGICDVLYKPNTVEELSVAIHRLFIKLRPS